MPDEKNYKTEWSFSFEKAGQDIGNFVKSLGVGDEETIKQAEFNAPLDGATSANVRVDFAVGEAVLQGLTNLDNLIEADLTYVGEINFVVSGEQEKTVVLSQRAAPADWVRNVLGWIGSQGKLRWDVGLATQVPMKLEVHGGVGKATLDLRELQITSTTINGGTGEINVTLPEKSEHYTAQITSGVGEIDVVVPAGSDVDLTLRGGAGEVKLDIGDGANVTADISGGVGECRIKLPQGAAARFEAQTGVGALRFPATVARVSGSDEFMSQRGVWETPNYATAERKITIKYKGGVGELKVS